VQFVLNNKRFELCWLTYKHKDFQVLVISGLSCRRDKTFIFLTKKIVNNFVNIYQIWIKLASWFCNNVFLK